MTTTIKKPTARELVTRHAEELRGMDHGELFRFSRAHGFDSRSGFAAYKKALKTELEIDYNALRAGKRSDQLKQLAEQATASLTLYSDAKASHDRFAICDRDGDPVWFGRFFDSDRDYDGEQSSGEMAAAKKAVWFASKVAEARGDKAIRLTLRVDAKWLCWANAAMRPGWDCKKGGKARALADAAKKLGVLLTVEHVDGRSNPADQWTVTTGYKKWSDNDLVAIAALDDAHREKDATR